MTAAQYRDQMRNRPPSGQPVPPTMGRRPERKVLHGDYCTLEPLDSRPGPPIEDVVSALTRELQRLSD